VTRDATLPFLLIIRLIEIEVIVRMKRRTSEEAVAPLR